MAYSRRQLLWAGQIALAAAALPKAALSSDWPEVDGELSAGKFKPLVNGSFRVELPSGSSQWFTLLSVEEMAAVPAVIPRHLKVGRTPKTETFALHFQSLGQPLPQGTLTFEHPSTGRIPLFIVPSGNSTYVAIINRLARD